MISTKKLKAQTDLFVYSFMIKPIIAIVSCFAFAIALSSCTDTKQAAGVVEPKKSELHFHSDFGAALADAQKTGKPIVTIFSASWCPPCQNMKKSVYPSEQVAPFHDSFVWAYLDADEAKNRDLMTQNGVEGIPHIAFISPRGEKLGKTVGAMGPQDFAGVLANILKKG